MKIRRNMIRCNYIKDDGILCESPAVRGASRCYHHRNLPERPIIFVANPFAVPLFTDNPVIQDCAMDVIASYRSGKFLFGEAENIMMSLYQGNLLLRRVQRDCQITRRTPMRKSAI
jgi:hypothetical protein